MDKTLNLTECLPSLTYSDAPADLAAWTITPGDATETDCERRTVTTYTAPDGLLALKITRVEYKDFPAVKYLPELVGCGKEPSRIVSSFRSLDVTIENLPWAETVLRATTGSTCQPSDFAARRFTLSNVSQQKQLDFTSDEGLSSTNWMPYFGVDLDDLDGFDFAIGWSGAWNMSVSSDKGALRLSFGMKRFRSYLKPGETLRQPSVIVLKRSGTSVGAFRTVIHDFMVKHNAPRDSQGRLLKPILPITISGGNRKPEDALKVIAYAAKERLPFDTVWMDAGWNGPEHIPDTTKNCGNLWWKYVGDWRINRGIHTTGTLLPISEAAHAAGMRFLLWFEPERVYNAPIATEHPEYCLKLVPTDPNVLQYILDLGNEEAFQWIFTTLCRIIDENKIDIYRQDFNVDPYSAWLLADEPDREGVSEARHVAGLYRLWDSLRKRYPDMLIDDCTAGGRRLDFELMSRAHSYCRSDYFVPRGNPEKRKYQFLMGQNVMLNLLDWVPFQGSEANCASTFNDYEFFSALGTGIVFTPPDWEGGCYYRDFTAEETAWFHKMFNIADRIRNILMGTFYPLTPSADLSESVWTAYEGMDATGEAGFAAFFRRTNAASSMVFELKGIDPRAQYEVEDAATGEREVLSGEALSCRKVAFEHAPDAKILFFRRLASKENQ